MPLPIEKPPSDKETLFIEAFSRTHDRLYAEDVAGYASGYGYTILEKPRIKDAILRRQMAKMTAEAMPLAVRTLVEIMSSTNVPAGARVNAAKEVLAHTMPVRKEGEQEVKAPHEMTADELAAEISKFETAAAAQAQPIEDAVILDDEVDIFS
jgi:hypothetical protein